MSSTEVATRSPRAIAEMAKVNADLTRRLEAIPEAEDDGGASLFWQLINAQSWEDLNDPWSAQGLAKLVGVMIRIEAIHKMPSDFPDGPGWYLVALAINLQTGEEVTFTTSSVAVMIQLIIAWTNKWMPLVCIPRVAEKPTKRGTYPQHLEIVNGPEQLPAGAPA